MKHAISLMVVAALALLGTACAEETAPKKETSAIAQNTAGATPQSSGQPGNSRNGTESGSTRSAVDLMEAPFRDAKRSGQLPANTAVTVLERSGGWMRISSKGMTGWARLHQIRMGEGTESKSTSSGLTVLKNVGETGRSGTQGMVATTGIRGLSAESLKNAKPNPAAVTSLDRYRVTASQARSFAQEAGLTDQKVPALPLTE